MENVVIVRVADVTNREAGDLIEIELRPGGDFSPDHHEIGFRVSLARNSALFVLRQAGIQNIIRNGVANLVRVALTHGF